MYFLSEDKHVDKHARVIITKMVRKKNKQKHKVNVSILLVLQKYRHHCPIVHPISCSETTEKRKRKARGEGTGSALAQTGSPEPETFVKILEESMCRTWNRPGHAHRCFCRPPLPLRSMETGDW